MDFGADCGVWSTVSAFCSTVLRLYALAVSRISEIAPRTQRSAACHSTASRYPGPIPRVPYTSTYVLATVIAHRTRVNWQVARQTVARTRAVARAELARTARCRHGQRTAPAPDWDEALASTVLDLEIICHVHTPQLYRACSAAHSHHSCQSSTLILADTRFQRDSRRCIP